MMSFSIPMALPHGAALAEAWQRRLAATWDGAHAHLPFLQEATCQVHMSPVAKDHIVL